MRAIHITLLYLSLFYAQWMTPFLPVHAFARVNFHLVESHLTFTCLYHCHLFQLSVCMGSPDIPAGSGLLPCFSLDMDCFLPNDENYEFCLRLTPLSVP